MRCSKHCETYIAIAAVVLLLTFICGFLLLKHFNAPLDQVMARGDALHTFGDSFQGSLGNRTLQTLKENRTNVFTKQPNGYSFEDGIKRLLIEDINRMNSVVILTPEQRAILTYQLDIIRGSDSLVLGAETQLLQRVLSPQQFELWQQDIVKQESRAAESYGYQRLREIEDIVVNLTEEQRDAIFDKMAQSLNGEPKADENILKEILTIDQLNKWLDSPDRVSQRIE